MREHLRIQVGDILYEASQSHKKVIIWIVCKFYIDYRTMNTVVQVYSEEYGYTERNPSVVCCWHTNQREAEECLEEMLL